MKCLLVLSALLAYCAGNTLRLPSQYKDGTKWELQEDGIADSSQAGTISVAYKKAAGQAEASVKKEVVTVETGYEKHLVVPVLAYEQHILPGYKKQEPIPVGIHIQKPGLPGLYQEPCVLVSVEHGKEVPKQQAGSIAAGKSAAIKTTEINAIPITLHQQPVHALPFYYYVF